MHKRNSLFYIVALACLFMISVGACRNETPKTIVPGTVWYDTDGNPINAHGGGIMFHKGVYYWYGEY